MLPLITSPRALHRLIVVRAIVTSVMLGGCVEATAYEQATSAAEVQGEARRRLSQDMRKKDAELAALRQEQKELEAENARLQAQLTDREGAVDEAELELAVAKQAKSEEAQLVQQLRGDLARVGSHLDTFADEKVELDLELATARAEIARLTEQVLDLQDQLAARPRPEAAKPEAAESDPPNAAAEPAGGKPASARVEPGDEASTDDDATAGT